jgi:hypothetical protein
MRPPFFLYWRSLPLMWSHYAARKPPPVATTVCVPWFTSCALPTSHSPSLIFLPLHLLLSFRLHVSCHRALPPILSYSALHPSSAFAVMFLAGGRCDLGRTRFASFRTKRAVILSFPPSLLPLHSHKFSCPSPLFSYPPPPYIFILFSAPTPHVPIPFRSLSSLPWHHA